MKAFHTSGIAATTLLAASLFAVGAQAATQSVSFSHLSSSATFANPFLTGDTLLIDTLVTTEVGALLQTVTFTVGAGVTGLTGGAVWQITTAAGPGPRLIGVNIDIFGPGNTLITSDGAATVAGGFAVSGLLSAITPGTYTLVATGTAVRESVLDISVSFVPEPQAVLMMLAGLAAVGFVASRRKAAESI